MKLFKKKTFYNKMRHRKKSTQCISINVDLFITKTKIKIFIYKH